MGGGAGAGSGGVAGAGGSAGKGGTSAGTAGAGGKGGSGAGTAGSGGGSGVCMPPSGTMCSNASPHSSSCSYVTGDRVVQACAPGVTTAGCCAGKRMLFQCVQMCDTQVPGDSSYINNSKWSIAGQCEGC
jgi:hypothetical protein